MTLRQTLDRIRDELDAKQIFVRFEVLCDGVRITADDYADYLIAKKEPVSRGIQVIGNPIL